MTNEKTITWYRRPALKFYREISGKFCRHVYALANSELLGFAETHDGQVSRVWFISHQEPGDGRGEHLPTPYNDIAVNPLSIGVGVESQPPDETFQVSSATIETEAKRHAELFAYWKRWRDHHAPRQEPPKKKKRFWG